MSETPSTSSEATEKPLPKSESQSCDPKPSPISNSEPSNKKGALTNLLHQPLSDEDAKELYGELKEDWANWSILRRSVQLRRLYRFELDHTPADEETIFDNFHAKIGFLSKEEITGYLELTLQSVGLKSAVNKEILSGEAVGLIGVMRLEFGDLFDNARIGSEIGKVAGDKTNFDEKKLLKTEAIEAVRKQLQEIQKRLSALRLGETYVINNDHPIYKKEYEGISDEEFELVPSDDPVYTECYRRQKPPTEKVLCRNKKQRHRVIFIDCRALCKPPDVKRKGY